MDRGSSGIRGLIDALSTEALKDILRGLRSHTELQRRIIRGELDQATVSRAYLDFAHREGPSYRRRVAELTGRYYRDLADLGSEYSAAFYGEILENGHVTQPSDPDGPSERVPMELHGEPGKEVVARFSLENTESSPVNVAFEVGVCTGPDGVAFTAPLSVHPASLTVPPGDQAQVTLRLAMLPSVFEPGHLYRTLVKVLGDRELELDVVIWAEESVVVLPNGVPEPPPDAEATSIDFTVRCGDCGREFARAERTTRLYPHKKPDGSPCPGRVGELIVHD
jgi:hypothetical protein